MTRAPVAGVDPRTVVEWMRRDEPVRILDVRTPAEHESVHIPGSYNVPLDTLGEHAQELRRHIAEPVVLVCRSGNRAAQAERRLAAEGMANVKVLDGGMLAWQAVDGPVRAGRQRWSLERQVRLVAGGIVLGGIIGSTVVPRLKYVSGAIGAGLTFAALTDTCAMGALLAKLPYNRAAACDVDAVVAELVATSRPAERPTA
jgi:rhodanese-related sulfurtransferase